MRNFAEYQPEFVILSELVCDCQNERFPLFSLHLSLTLSDFCLFRQKKEEQFLLLFSILIDEIISFR